MSQIDRCELATSWSSEPLTVDSDDIVKAGLRLLRELDVFLAVGVNRLDDIPEAGRSSMHAAFTAASAALAAVQDRIG